MNQSSAPNLTEAQLLSALENGFRRLRFSAPLEELYLSERADEGLRRGRIAAMTGIIIFSLFAIKDVLLLPQEIAIWTTGIRMGVLCPALLFMYLVLDPHGRRPDPTLPMCGVLLLCGHGLALCLLIPQAAGVEVHYAGIFLVTIAGYFLTGLRMAPAAFANLSFCISYIIGLITLKAPDIGLTAFYLLMGNGISMIGAWSLELYARRYFIMRTLAELRSEHDALTGLFNRGAIQNKLIELWRLSRRNGDSMAVIMADVDYFKAFNDTYGHLTGDECLKALSSCLEEQISRPLDTVARFGGEEFIFVLYEVDVGFVERFCERCREAVESLAIPHESSDISEVVTISLGAAIANGYNEDGYEKLIGKADAALYEAKAGGRNRHVTHAAPISLAS